MEKHPDILPSHQWAALVGILLLAALMIITFRQPLKDQPAAEPPVVSEMAEEAPITRQSISGRWLFTGEVFWGRQIEVLAEESANPYKYPFAGFKSFDRSKYDAWIGQLECPVTSRSIPFSIQANQLRFNCSPNYLPQLAKWYDALSLATNHTDDHGSQGLDDTRKNLEKNDIQHFGHYDPAVSSDICEVISLPVQISLSDGETEEALLPVAFCGYNYVYRGSKVAEIEEIARYSDRFLTIISPHMGAEYVPEADPLKEKVFRSMIDQGADMVLASHPHWVQNTEVYEGKLIAYSLGNWLFDQEWSEEVKRGVAIDLALGTGYDENLSEWLKLGESCLDASDSCLEMAEEMNLKKPIYVFSFELVSGYHQNGQTRKASETIHQYNLERTNWDETKVKINPHD